MTYPLTPEMQAAIAAPVVRPAILLYIDHTAGPFRVWSGVGNIKWGADTYYGAGALLGATAEEQAVGVEVAGMKFSLIASDLSEDVMALITQPIRRRPIFSWKALLDECGNVIPEPRFRFGGYVDTPRIVDSDIAGTGKLTRIVEVTVQEAFSNLTTPPRALVSHEEQQSIFPDDNGLAFMSTIETQNTVWTIGPYNNFTPPA